MHQDTFSAFRDIDIGSNRHWRCYDQYSIRKNRQRFSLAGTSHFTPTI
jgi:hypothetical protein